jgi:hypothetical protein
MPGSPKECRNHAMVCWQLAETLPDGHSRKNVCRPSQDLAPTRHRPGEVSSASGYLLGVEPAIPLPIWHS